MAPALPSARLSIYTFESRLCRRGDLMLLFDRHPDGPDETQQFPPHRTSPAVSATATTIVSAWTSRPTKRNLDMSDQFLSYAALRRWFHLFAA